MADTPKATEPDQVQRGDPPRDARRSPGEGPVALLGPGQPARDQEADGAQRVGTPDRVVLRRRAQPDEQRAQRGPVEPQRPEQLDGGRPPVDAAVPDPQQRAGARSRCGSTRSVGVRRDLHVLQEGGRREEDGSDEEGDVVRRGARRRWRRAGTSPARSRRSRRRTARPSTSAMANGAHQVEPPRDAAGVLAVPPRIPHAGGCRRGAGRPPGSRRDRSRGCPGAATPRGPRT